VAQLFSLGINTQHLGNTKQQKRKEHSMSKNYHNDGEKDASEGKYEPPHDILDDLITFSPEKREKMHEENDSYNDGWNNTHDQKSSSGGCFLTTACVEHAGLADDCHELQVLRHFRDDYVATLPDGEAILAEYYKSAPTIVRRIQLSQQRDDVLRRLFGTVKEAVTLIEAGCHKQAFDSYVVTFKKLNEQYGDA
jgi:hypothetical protein